MVVVEAAFWGDFQMEHLVEDLVAVAEEHEEEAVQEALVEHQEL